MKTCRCWGNETKQPHTTENISHPGPLQPARFDPQIGPIFHSIHHLWNSNEYILYVAGGLLQCGLVVRERSGSTVKTAKKSGNL